MDFRPIVAPSIRELFIQQVEGAILSGQLKPGDQLPTERELADTMHISKTVVHEGLRELHRLGFLDIASRRGATALAAMLPYLTEQYGNPSSLYTLGQTAATALAQALFRYHRGVTFLSGNTITPLLFNAFMQVNLEFWSGYIRSVGREESLRTLARRPAAGRRPAALCDHAVNSHFVQNIRLFLWKRHRFRSDNSAICQLCSPPGVV